MATTQTYARATTSTRIDLLQTQIRVALRRCTNITQVQLYSVGLGIEKKWIREVVIYGLNAQQLCRAQISLEIDWHAHEVHLSQGRAVVATDSSWEDNACIEVQEAVGLFNRFVSANQLATKWQVNYALGLDGNEINQQLGFSRAEAVKWTNSPKMQSFVAPELSELKVGCYLSE
jgi:hypothetical protein